MVLLSVGTLATFTEPPPCDPQLRPDGGRLGYLPRRNRCEGLYVSPIAGRSLQIMSYLVGTLRFNTSDATLNLRVADTPILNALQLHARAVALPLNTYYRMDAPLTPGEWFDWPIGEVLVPTNLGPARVGLFGWADSPEGRLLVPIEVSDAATSDQQMTLIVRSAVDTNEVVWRWRAIGSLGPAVAWQTAAAQPTRSGHPIRITIPRGPPEILRAEIASQERSSGQWSSLAFLIVRPELP